MTPLLRTFDLLPGELVIDNFAGGGGASTGITRALAEDDARRRACTVAPLYLAPPLRDVSGVIAQCEEALREWDREGPRSASASSLVAVTLTKARNALRGAS